MAPLLWRLYKVHWFFFSTCSLWFGAKKPDMSYFFKPFVEECASLCEAGFEWQHPSDQSLRHIKVRTLCCVCDAEARPLLQNFKQFNGRYGCGVCLHPGIQTRERKGNRRVYTCPDEKASDRNHKTTVEIERAHLLLLIYHCLI